MAAYLFVAQRSVIRIGRSTKQLESRDSMLYTRSLVSEHPGCAGDISMTGISCFSDLV